MDQKWQKNLLAFLGLLAGLFTVWAFIQERPSKIVDERADFLDKRIIEEKNTVMAYVDAKDQAKSIEIQSVNSNINEKFGILMRMLEKLDDRVYEMQNGHRESAMRGRSGEDGT